MPTLIIVLLLQLCYSIECELVTSQVASTEFHIGNMDESIGLMTHGGYWEIGVNQNRQNGWLLVYNAGEIWEKIKSEDEAHTISYNFKKVKTDKDFYKDNERFNRIDVAYQLNQFREQIQLDETIQMIKSEDSIIIKDTHENNTLQMVLMPYKIQFKQVDEYGKTTILKLDFWENTCYSASNGRVREVNL